MNLISFSRPKATASTVWTRLSTIGFLRCFKLSTKPSDIVLDCLGIAGINQDIYQTVQLHYIVFKIVFKHFWTGGSHANR